MRKINQWKDFYNHPFMPHCVKVSRLLSKNSYFEGICTRRVGAICIFELSVMKYLSSCLTRTTGNVGRKSVRRGKLQQVMLEMGYIIFRQYCGF